MPSQVMTPESNVVLATADTEMLDTLAMGFGMGDLLETPDFRRIVEEAEVGICITQEDRLVYVNPKFAAMHGYRPEEMVDSPIQRLVHPAERARVARVRRLRATGQHRSAYETTNVHRDGSAIEVRVYGRPIEYRGRPAHLVTMSDIGELVEANRLATWRARMLERTELLSESGSVEIEPGRCRMRLSSGAQALLGVHDGADGVPIRAILRRIPAPDRGAVFGHWRRARPGKAFECRHRLTAADGRIQHVRHRGLIERTEAGEAPRRVAILQDVTERTEAQAEIDRLLNYHPVTGLATRALLLRRAAAAMEVATLAGRPLAMMYLRVPDLDRVHDGLGLSAGEALATTLAARIVQCCRDVDTAAHLGGGEFAVLLDPTEGADERHALALATRILGALEAPAVIAATELFLGGRIGVALYPRDAASAGELLAHAHAACRRGDAGVSFFTHAAGERAARRLRLEGALRRAFERGELSLKYQPQIDLQDGSMVGAEALLRWTSAEFGEVSPAEFVPIAEEIGLIVAIGEWVFRTACRQSVAWVQAGLKAVRIGVNLSPRQLEQPDISRRLQSILLETGADPAHLGIEVTESMLMRDLEAARTTLEELSALGIEIALDDFGTGYSNLGVLRALPFDVIKIDRSLVHDVTAAPEDVSITRAVLMLAQGLKIKVLAEGVETEGQLQLLISNGCELMQGYIFSRPVAAEALEAMLRDGRGLPGGVVPRAPRRRSLLLVDNEDHVLSSLRRLLRSDGYRIVSARSGAEGLARLAESEIDVIVADQRMPGMTGVEFLRRAKELYPDTVRIVLSGYTEVQAIADAVNEGAIYKFLTKPWDDAQLRAQIREAFRRKELADEQARLASDVRSANLELAVANQRQEQQLTRQRERLDIEARHALHVRDLLEALPASVIGIDADGLVAFANRSARALMGDDRPLVGCDAEDVLPADWLGAGLGVHSVSFDGRRYAVSRGAIDVPDRARQGYLLSLVPLPDADAEQSS